MLSLLDISGPFLSLPVLVRRFLKDWKLMIQITSEFSGKFMMNGMTISKDLKPDPAFTLSGSSGC